MDVIPTRNKNLPQNFVYYFSTNNISRENINDITENEIENLEIDSVRGFVEISNIVKFKKLKFLGVEEIRNLEKIDFDKQMLFLKTLRISNCKRLNSITGLHYLTSLERLGIYQTKIDFDRFIEQDLPASLKAIRFYTSKSKLNDAIKTKITGRDYTD